MTETHISRFLTVAAVITIGGNLLAMVTPLAADASAAFTGSIVTSGLLGTVFAGRSAQLFRRRGTVSLPAAVLTTIFGIWFMTAPLLYDVGFLSTAGTQLAGMFVASFALYLVVAGLSRSGE